LLIPAFAVAFMATVIMLLAIRPIAIRRGLVDTPGGRKRHIGAVPIIGGVAMFGAFVLSSALIDFRPELVPILLAAAVLVFIGVIDDRSPLPAVVRMGAQVLVVLLLFFGANIRIETLGDVFGFGAFDLGIFSLPMTALIAVSVINAFNLVDGADGLAGTMAVLALGPAAILAGYTSFPGQIAILGIAVTLGFLCFNFPTPHNRRIRTFMGDAGSTFVGFLVVTCIAAVSQGPSAVISPTVGLWFAALPIYDLFTCFVQRIRKGRSPVMPGRDHFHHVMARGGFTVRASLGILTLLQATYVAIGLLGHYAGVPEFLMFAAWAAVGLSQWKLIRVVAKLARHKRRSAFVRIAMPDCDEEDRKAA